MRIKPIKNRKDVYQGIGLWNRNNPEFKIIDRLIQQNVFYPFTNVNVTGFLILDNEQIKGFSLVKYLDSHISDYVNKNYGWISLFVVDKKTANFKTVAQKLLNETEEFLLENGVEEVRFGGDPQNFIPGLPVAMKDDYYQILKEGGFNSGSCEFDLYRNIESFKQTDRIDIIEQKHGKELLVSSVSKSKERYLLEFLRENFPGRWYFEADNIRRIPGGVNDYFLLYFKGNPVGFARTNTHISSYMGPNVNWGSQWGKKYCGLGPIGIDKDFRGRGWGLYLMLKIITLFQEKGYQHMVIDWTTLINYYKKIGFSPWREYETMSKKVEG